MFVVPFELITKDRAAEILGVSIRSLENYVKDGLMPAPKPLGRRLYWHSDDFYGWLDAHFRESPADAAGSKAPSTESGQDSSSPETKAISVGKIATKQASRAMRQTAVQRASARSKALIDRLCEDDS